VPPLLQMAGHGGHLELKNSKQETDHIVLTITKALTKTTNCTFRAKKWRGTTHTKFSGAKRWIGTPPPLSLWTGGPSHFQIRSGATGYIRYSQPFARYSLFFSLTCLRDVLGDRRRHSNRQRIAICNEPLRE